MWRNPFALPFAEPEEWKNNEKDRKSFEPQDDPGDSLLSKIYFPFISAYLSVYPTCSTYFIQALEKYGVCKGSYLGMKRILKCHPWHEGGYDPLK